MSFRQNRSLGEPLWLDLGSGRPHALPDQVHHWLSDAASLTRRVTAACGGRFRVRVVSQAWGTAYNSERELLGLGPRAACLVREVELLCDEVPQVFARTLMPARSLTGAARRLALLRDKPLGAVLFADPHTRRERVQIARFQPRHRLWRVATGHLAQVPAEVWGRRTLFRYAGRPILVNELFLPALVERDIRPVRGE
jgi:chorismate--pyruvate lyase